jgi:general secretion pathway protein A
MYLDFFGLKELPFSIAPDPRYLYMSERHREALAHLLYGVSGQGGFVVLTGEVGTGKTTICRCFLNQIPKNTDVAFIINPKLSARELMASICDELGIAYSESASIKTLNDLINDYLLEAHANNRHTVLIIDEAQNLRVDVLEQLRLLTNLETSEKKLLQIILLGQPELREVLAQNELRQLAQRITARYHLHELSKVEVGAYVSCRLAVAGRRGRLFNQAAIKTLFKLSGGVPRLINLICDRALLGAYASQCDFIEAKHVQSAYKEIQGEQPRISLSKRLHLRTSIPVIIGVVTLSIMAWYIDHQYFDRINTLEAALQKQDLNTSVENSKATPQRQSPEDKQVYELAQQSTATVMDDQSSLAQEQFKPQTERANTVEVNDKKSAPVLEQLTGLKARKDDKFFAFQSLFKRWGVDYPQAPFMLACNYGEMYGLRCLHKNGNWRSLLKLDRPAVLTLVNELGEALYLSLLAIEGQDALVSHGQKQYWTSLDEIDRYWLGEYSILWKLPPYKSSLIQPGQKKEDVWLMTSLARLNRYNSSKGESLEAQIKRFQSSVGLKPDGIPGSMTLIHINSRLNLDTPKLMGGY